MLGVQLSVGAEDLPYPRHRITERGTEGDSLTLHGSTLPLDLRPFCHLDWVYYR